MKLSKRLDSEQDAGKVLVLICLQSGSAMYFSAQLFFFRNWSNKEEPRTEIPKILPFGRWRDNGSRTLGGEARNEQHPIHWGNAHAVQNLYFTGHANAAIDDSIESTGCELHGIALSDQLHCSFPLT